jgi:hypothetical protein
MSTMATYQNHFVNRSALVLMQVNASNPKFTVWAGAMGDGNRSLGSGLPCKTKSTPIPVALETGTDTSGGFG